MTTRAPLHLLVVVVVVAAALAGYRNTFVSALENDCSFYDVQLRKGDVRVVYTEENISIATWRSTVNRTHMYLKPSEGFEGVGVQLEGSGWNHFAWFPLEFPEDQCLPQRGEWGQIDIGMLTWGRATPSEPMLWLQYGGCLTGCHVSIMEEDSRYNVSLVGYGPSLWRHTFLDPESCTFKEATGIPFPASSKPCLAPPSTPAVRSAGHRQPAAAPATVVLGVTLAVAVVVSVVPVWW